MCKEKFRHHGFRAHGVFHHFPFGECCCGASVRRFPSREEQLRMMENYKKDLEQELAEVSKYIEDLKK